jgi:hypothetical protein
MTNATAAQIIVNSALSEMARTSGAEIGEILTAMLATPDGAAAVRFRKLVALGTKAIAL